MPRQSLVNRSIVIDAIKVVASQVIVLHHLALYAPMADWINPALSVMFSFIEDHGRYAVQPFLVIGGFLAAQTLNHTGHHRVWESIWRRYWRLMPQLALALFVVVAATAWLGDELAHEGWLSPLPEPEVFLAHLLLVQDLLDIPSMSAGAWYVAIDLQLFAVLALLAQRAHLSGQSVAQSSAPAWVALLTVTSILIFSRLTQLDDLALYFFSAYGLGALVVWAGQSEKAKALLIATLSVLLVDLMITPRPRPLLALLTTLCLLGFSSVQWQNITPVFRQVILYLSNISYGVFVSHFAMIIVFSGLWEKLGLEGNSQALMVLFCSWLASILMGAAIQRICEKLRLDDGLNLGFLRR